MFKFMVVAAAVYNAEKQTFLIAQRPRGKTYEGLWEFPGGKIERHETPEQAIVREIKEELDVELDPEALEPMTFYSSSIDKRRHFVMVLYLCRSYAGRPRSMEKQAFAWVSRDELSQQVYPMHDGDAALATFLVRHFEQIQ